LACPSRGWQNEQAFLCRECPASGNPSCENAKGERHFYEESRKPGKNDTGKSSSFLVSWILHLFVRISRFRSKGSRLRDILCERRSWGSSPYRGEKDGTDDRAGGGVRAGRIHRGAASSGGGGGGGAAAADGADHPGRGDDAAAVRPVSADRAG